MIKRILCLCSSIIILGIFLSCGSKPKTENGTTARDLQEIKENKELVILTLYGSTSYFMYRGYEMGFHYELAKQFAEYLNVNLRIEVAKTLDELYEKLYNEEGDLIAYNLPITKEKKDSVNFCGQEAISHQVIVQKKDKNRLSDVTQLIGKTIHVMSDRYYNRLINLNNELGGGIDIVKMSADSLSTEDLIEMVSKGQIEYTVADNELALINKTYYNNIDISLIISFDQRTAWATRKNSPELTKAANEWYKNSTKTTAYTATTKRYFEISKQLPFSPVLSIANGKISHFDHHFKKYAEKIDWDWRLLASLAYTESNFDSTAVSWAGAKGLMQLMPRTAKAMGVPNGKEFYVEESIKGATKYIATVEKHFLALEKKERIKFVLGSYNAGVGHILDARALANKYGHNENIWNNNVEKYILLKSNPEYFTDPVCKHGYFRGTETYNFVREIIARYEFYQKKIKD
ncbi:MAG: transporter substrate-binding domain-containing protein [Bacteroidales bacterium]|nr:transporter substrate-binding domain-containing protein [Bacteroidales bacterium]